MGVLKVVLIVVLSIVAIVVAVGSLLPKEHVASRSLVVARPQADVWAMLTDYAGQAAWRSGLDSVQRGPDHNGNPVWIEKSGRDALPLETTEVRPMDRLVRTIADSTLPFGGRWVYELKAEGSGTRLTITEEGEVYNPVFRFMSRFVIGQASTIEKVLKDLAKQTGSPAQIES